MLIFKNLGNFLTNLSYPVRVRVKGFRVFMVMVLGNDFLGCCSNALVEKNMPPGDT